MKVTSTLMLQQAFTMTEEKLQKVSISPLSLFDILCFLTLPQFGPPNTLNKKKLGQPKYIIKLGNQKYMRKIPKSTLT